jgi:Zn-dependent protease with chaperone function
MAELREKVDGRPSPIEGGAAESRSRRPGVGAGPMIEKAPRAKRRYPVLRSYMTQVDLSFSRYVAARKDAASARSREGAAYSYGGDLKVRQALSRIRPVTLAIEATVRLWQTVEKSRLLGMAVKVSERQFPKLHGLAVRCAETLQIPRPTLYVSPNIGALNAHTFGTTDDACVVLNAALIDHLSDMELLDVIGHECGHIQNDHAVYMTALYLLTQMGNTLLRWGARPAVLALKSWARRAEITCDRAGLLCTRDLNASIGCLVKLALGSKKLYSEVNLEEYLKQMDESRGAGRFDELGRSHPYLPKRIAALRLFAETTYYQGVSGGPVSATALSKVECDARVSQILSVLG